MKLKTRLLVTFLITVLLPLILILIAFFILSSVLSQNSGPVNQLDAGRLKSIQNFADEINVIYDNLEVELQDAEFYLEESGNVEALNQKAEEISAYVLIRKEEELYYAGNGESAERIFYELPAAGDMVASSSNGYYYSDLQKYVRQKDFVFSDGDIGSVFIIAKVDGLLSKNLFIDMALSIILILIVTSVLLTRWIHASLFTPIRELNQAMSNIADGNFDYRIETKTKGEIGALYKNYDDMRVRLKASSEEKIENDKQNRELISNISHDLKTPITAIKGYVEGIMDGVADTPEKVDKYIRTVYTKANDMDRLINELTLYSGINANRIPYNFHRLRVKDYFDDCVDEVGLDLEQRDIKLNYINLVDSDTMIIADPEQLRRVINNIVGNSIKYMDKEQGLIEIRVVMIEDSIRVEIEDNGSGIPTKDLGNIFERFFRTDASRNSSRGGSGIGLSIVKKIIEDHGGYIWATSKEHEGTCLHFVIRKYKEVDQDE